MIPHILHPVEITPKILAGLKPDKFYHVLVDNGDDVFWQKDTIGSNMDIVTHIYLPLESKAEPDGWKAWNSERAAWHWTNIFKTKEECESEIKKYVDRLSYVGKPIIPVFFSPSLSNEVREVSDEEIKNLADRRTKALNDAEKEYGNERGNHYRDNERFSWAVTTINKKFVEDLRPLFSNKLVVKDGFEEYLLGEINKCQVYKDILAEGTLRGVLSEYLKLQPQGGKEWSNIIELAGDINLCLVPGENDYEVKQALKTLDSLDLREYHPVGIENFFTWFGKSCCSNGKGWVAPEFHHYKSKREGGMDLMYQIFKEEQSISSSVGQDRQKGGAENE